ncbi:MAG TPA: hypothetical protein VFN10_18415, partial [Thermoanaerobaculia bacterium]|nr:hypothetical protein [Thermoanaerobaculia bacterium]
MLLFASGPAAAQCNPYSDPTCGESSAQGPDVGFSPSGGTFLPEEQSGGFTLPVTISFLDADGLDPSTLQIRRWEGASSVPLSLAWSTNVDGTRGTASGNVTFGFGEHVLVAEISDRRGNKGSGRATFTFSGSDQTLPVLFADSYHSDYRDTALGGLVLTYSGPSYTSMGTSRTIGALMHNSELARPTGSVLVDARPGSANASEIVAMSLRVERRTDSSLMFPEVFYKLAGAGDRQRLGANWNWTVDGTPTGAYRGWAVVRAYKADKTYKETRLPIRWLVLNASKSRYGAGWILAGVKRIHTAVEGVMMDEGNGVLRFYAGTCGSGFADCTYTTPAGDHSRLVYRPTTKTYLRTYPDGGYETFAGVADGGLMTASSDRFGNSTKVEWQYTQDGTNTPVVSRITDPVGKMTTFAYDASWYLASVTTPGGGAYTVSLNSAKAITEILGARNLRLTYTDSFRKVASWNWSYGAGSIADPARTTDVTYDDGGKVKTITAPTITISDGSTARPQTVYRSIEKVVVPEQWWLPSTSVDNPAPAVPATAALTEVTDPAGHTTKLAPNRYGHPTIVIDPLGNVTNMTWNADGMLVSLLSPTESRNNYYDRNGNLLQSIVNGATVFEASYDSTGSPEFVMNGRNANWYEYGPRGEVTKTWYGKRDDSNKTATRYEYNARYQVTAVVDPKGARSEWSYENNVWKNADYVRIHRDDGTSVTTSFTYDDASRVRTVTDPLNGTTTSDYDALNRPVRTLDALGLATSFQYTGANLTKVTDTAGKAYGFAYNASGWLESESFPDGGTRTYKYDRDGLQTAVTDRRGLSIGLSYDAGHRAVTRVADGATTTFGYPDLFTTVVTNNESTITTKLVPGVGSLDSVTSTLAGKRFEIKRVYDPNDALRNLGFDLKTFTGDVAGPTSSMRFGIDFRPNDVSLGATYSLTDLTGRVSTINMDTAGHPVRITLPNGVTQS